MDGAKKAPVTHVATYAKYADASPSNFRRWWAKKLSEIIENPIFRKSGE